MGQLLGQIRDLEARWSDESVTHLVEQNAQLKQRVQHDLGRGTGAGDQHPPRPRPGVRAHFCPWGMMSGEM
ncbi:hypothetical protein ACFYS7_40300, partial [Streptomyces avermitilis]